MSIEASNINFGAFPAGDANQNLILTCTDSAAGEVNNSASDDATCGVITVSSSDDFNYKLAVSATPSHRPHRRRRGLLAYPDFQYFRGRRHDRYRRLGRHQRRNRSRFDIHQHDKPPRRERPKPTKWEAASPSARTKRRELTKAITPSRQKCRRRRKAPPRDDERFRARTFKRKTDQHNSKRKKR